MFHHLDLDMLSSPQPSPVNQFANTSKTNTSDRSSSKDLSQILVDIRSCRWRHFRPRTPSLHDSATDELCSRRAHRSINRAGTAQPGTHTGASTQSKSSSGSTHCGTFLCGFHCYVRAGYSILLSVAHYAVDALSSTLNSAQWHCCCVSLCVCPSLTTITEMVCYS